VSGWPGKPALHDTWRGMIRRCEQPSARSYDHYGGRGITVCAEWHDYKAFETWILENLGPRPAGCTLDRIYNNGSYRPGNVRWATRAEQRATRRPPWWDWPEFAERRIKERADTAALTCDDLRPHAFSHKGSLRVAVYLLRRVPAQRQTSDACKAGALPAEL